MKYDGFSFSTVFLGHRSNIFIYLLCIFNVVDKYPCKILRYLYCILTMILLITAVSLTGVCLMDQCMDQMLRGSNLQPFSYQLISLTLDLSGYSHQWSKNNLKLLTNSSKRQSLLRMTGVKWARRKPFYLVDTLIAYKKRGIWRKVLISMRGNPCSLHNESFIGDKCLQSVKKQACSF